MTWHRPLLVVAAPGEGAPNHRFTTSLATYQDFTTTKGWLPEGVVFCAPP